MHATGPTPGTGLPTPKGFRTGTHRLVPPEETVARVLPFLPAMGITRIADVIGLDCIGIPVVMVMREHLTADPEPKRVDFTLEITEYWCELVALASETAGRVEGQG